MNENNLIDQIEKQIGEIVCPFGLDQKTQIRAWRKGITDAIAAVTLVLESEIGESK